VDGDVLELFLLQHRVLVVGAEIEVVSPATGLIIQPCTRSGVHFDSINCTLTSKAIYAPFGGKLDRTTELETHSFVVEEPDFFGLRIISGAAGLTDLAINVTLSVSDEFSLHSNTNST